MNGRLIAMPTAFKPTHLFVLECGHRFWPVWPDAPDQILEGSITCGWCHRTSPLEMWWKIP